MGEPGPRGPYGLPVSSLFRAWSPPSPCMNVLSLAQLTNHLRGTSTVHSSLILYNSGIPMSFQERPCSCHIPPLMCRHTHTRPHMGRLRGRTNLSAGFPPSVNALPPPSDWVPLVGTSSEGHCTRSGCGSFIKTTFFRFCSHMLLTKAILANKTYFSN